MSELTISEIENIERECCFLLDEPIEIGKIKDVKIHKRQAMSEANEPTGFYGTLDLGSEGCERIFGPLQLAELESCKGCEAC